MKYVVSLPIVGVKASFNLEPRAVDGVCMSPSTLMKETDRVGDGLGRIAVRRPGYKWKEPSILGATQHQDKDRWQKTANLRPSRRKP
jgi:hypothetical protein